MEKLYYNLNTAFSINFMILQNLDRLLNTSKTIFSADDIFGEKTSAEYHYEMYFKDFAEIRNDYFDEIRGFFSAELNFKSFATNAQYLIDEYNNCFGKNLQFSNLFSSRNIKNWELFNQLFSNIEHIQEKSSFEILKLQFALSQFLIFYDDYKDWLSAYEIFEVLNSDITSYGSKSLYYGKPESPDIFILNFDDYHKYSKIITKFLTNFNKKSKKQNLKDDFDTEQISFQAIIDFYNKIENRFGYANSHLMELGSIWSKLKYKLSHMSDGDFKINEIYIHRNEILTLLSALATFPELHEVANQISLKFLGKNVEYFQNKAKENT